MAPGRSAGRAVDGMEGARERKRHRVREGGGRERERERERSVGYGSEGVRARQHGPKNIPQQSTQASTLKFEYIPAYIFAHSRPWEMCACIYLYACMPVCSIHTHTHTHTHFIHNWQAYLIKIKIFIITIITEPCFIIIINLFAIHRRARLRSVAPISLCVYMYVCDLVRVRVCVLLLLGTIPEG
jgi:hypothetical protein